MPRHCGDSCPSKLPCGKNGSEATQGQRGFHVITGCPLRSHEVTGSHMDSQVSLRTQTMMIFIHNLTWHLIATVDGHEATQCHKWTHCWLKGWTPFVPVSVTERRKPRCTFFGKKCRYTWMSRSPLPNTPAGSQNTHIPLIVQHQGQCSGSPTLCIYSACGPPSAGTS